MRTGGCSDSRCQRDEVQQWGIIVTVVFFIQQNKSTTDVDVDVDLLLLNPHVS